MQFFVSNFYATTFLVICCMGIVLELEAASAPSSQVQLEANAIINSGWWNLPQQSDPDDICLWEGIECNEAGSIITIVTYWYITQGHQFGKLNLSAFKNLERLELTYCGVQGTIPPEIGDLLNLTHLDLSGNSLSGILPISITKLTKLELFDISNNFISGETPTELGYLPSLKKLHLSYNNLTGTVPPFPFNQIDVDVDVDISYNNLEGPIPDGFPASALIGNKGVCSDNGFIQTTFQFQPCPTHGNKVLLNLAIASSILTFLMMVFLLLVYLWDIRLAIMNKHTKTTATTKNNGDLFSIWNYDGSIAYEDIIRATQDFDMKYCIGTGAHGSVYKAQLPSGKTVALKKLHGFEAEVPAFDESFRNEIKVLSEIKHRNIVQLY